MFKRTESLGSVQKWAKSEKKVSEFLWLLA